jgi:hypothetical protein
MGIIKFLFGGWINQVKGHIGENFIYGKLLELDPSRYKILNDLLLKSEGNLNTTQIDHVVVSNYGIFCIETKDYAGWIFGNANQEQWTQVIYRTKSRFYNPLRQNYAHGKAIEAIVRPRYPSVPIIPYVAFPSADKLKIAGTTSVGHGRDLIHKILSFQQQVLSDADRDIIYQMLMNANINSKAMRELHDDSVQVLKEINSR